MATELFNNVQLKIGYALALADDLADDVSGPPPQTERRRERAETHVYLLMECLNTAKAILDGLESQNYMRIIRANTREEERCCE